MSVRIRMKKMGRPHRPFFRVCAMDIRAPRDGKVIEAPAATTKKLSVTHRGRAYTLQRIKRTRPQRAAIARDLRDAAHSAMIRALAATLHLLPAFLQHGRLLVDSRQRPN